MNIWAPALVIFLAVVGLITLGIVYGGIPELQVEQVLAGDYSGQEVKVKGIIMSIESEFRPLRFAIRSFNEPDAVMHVEIDDVRPDLYKVDTDVAVVGIFDTQKILLQGDKIYTKCPSKYEASEELGSPGKAYPPGKPEPVQSTSP
ncbi:MAG: cytochrome c maturation protein CcmE [Planctomycetota bacterium]